MTRTNRLARETSPYLRQHAENPVDWYPWGDEALAVAAALDRPLFVSIGYSSCHWCHVMAHESFEDESIAERLNASFVAVKVDREERPDLDAIYLEAVQALTGSGGWPLSVFATPDGRPFFGGTYFPARDRPGHAGFATVLDAVAQAWRERRGELTSQADELTGAVAQRLHPPQVAPGAPSVGADELVERAIERFEALYDPEHGGLGGAPKFPQPPILELVLRAQLGGRAGLDHKLGATLAAMASGGIYDHLGGGFARYSVDRAWQVPHFEKMLYDQALLARLYLHAWQVSGDARWRQVLDETLGYVLRDLAAPGGGLCCAEDADSEGEEGRFYVFSPGELLAALGAEGAAVAADWYGVDARGNVEGGRTVLHRRVRGDLLRPAAVEACRAALFAARAERVRPGLDDKILTEWNAMAASVLAEAAGATGDRRYRAAAVGIGEFLLAHLRDPGGRWQRARTGGQARHLAVAGDYAWLVDCFTRLGELTGRARWTLEAERTARELVALFSAEDGGWYTTGADAPALVVRPRDAYDGVTPAAGSVAALALARLGTILGDDGLLDRARATVDALRGALEAGPLAFAHLLGAASLLEHGALEIVVGGDRPALAATAQRWYLPEAVLAWGEATPSPLFTGREDGRAYVCRHGVCLEPAGDAAALEARIRREVEMAGQRW